MRLLELAPKFISEAELSPFPLPPRPFLSRVYCETSAVSSDSR